MSVKHTVKHHWNNAVITQLDNLSGDSPVWTKTAIQVETESQYLIYELVKTVFSVTLTESQKFNNYVWDFYVNFSLLFITNRKEIFSNSSWIILQIKLHECI